MRNLIYLGFYSTSDDKKNRNHSLAAVNKMNYISNVFKNLDFFVTILSPSWTNKEDEFSFFKSEKIILSKGLQVIYAPSFNLKIKNKFKPYLFKILLSFFWTVIYLIKNKDINFVIVYHQPMLIIPLLISKKIKHFKLILEVEEIYSDVWKERKLFIKLEKMLLQLADGYILSTHTLVDKINSNKPYIVSYGELKHNKQIVKKYKDKIHLVFAGTFDPLKGVIESINTARYLDNNYHLHIIGFGNQKETENVLNLINETNKNSSCKVTYDGCLKGDDYIEFIQKCHIGLSTISKRKIFIDSVFPSKILSYLCNNLYVVSGDLKSVLESPFSHFIKFYYEDNPESIAKAIREVKIDENYDKFVEQELKKIDEKFKNRISKFI
ncbi:MAG: Uncharacterized protein XD76_0183 [candidate division TA06 bacterium 32_111]|uniref:Glycosyl transferase family 1 domain-containing protein n=2 Tax=Bacteria candidate phyla TaxID=1783234 RepID=A0A117M741_UNCT6|nr:MAG: Uncharacterized protein XD76_0183 [candidate division TA06 bacterium 32_111]KUK88001.1 MAG: Uncharacterized protein XE03_0007 [candidate division TA06 bacterium 34_109]HAF06929.1 hypothetical protein [candidate division WOR-3 bacterium]HCP16843.1 hypothetical protein [candidate division WOR-3 bacterium]